MEQILFEIQSSEVSCDELMSSDYPPLLIVHHYLIFQKNLQHQLLPLFSLSLDDLLGRFSTASGSIRGFLCQ